MKAVFRVFIAFVHVLDTVLFGIVNYNFLEHLRAVVKKIFMDRVGLVRVVGVNILEYHSQSVIVGTVDHRSVCGGRLADINGLGAGYLL